MRRLIPFAAFVVAFGAANVSPATAAIVTYEASLSGAAESPPVASGGIGWARVTIDDMLDTMRVEAEFSGLTGNVTVAHIHCCTAVPGAGAVTPASPTPTFPGFPDGGTAGSYDQLFNMTLATSYRAGFITDNGGTPASAFSALLQGLDEGRAYLNIHSTFAGGGEIRGFLARVPEPATLALVGLALAALALQRPRRA